MLAAVDTGGTFTDAVTADGRVTKVLSIKKDPPAAISKALGELAEEVPDLLAHGTTVATNALLERKGLPVALLTNKGFGDVIEIARQDRPSLYDQWTDRPEPLVPRELRFEVAGRLDASGKEIEKLGHPGLTGLPSGVRTVAVCLLHSDLNDAHERTLGKRLEAAGFDPVLSVDVSPEFREYERTVTTVINAYLRPVCAEYLKGVSALAGQVMVMTSSGGLISPEEASEMPALLLLSGPAGGVRAAAEAAVAAGFPNAVTLDMGGTSTDVGLVLGGMAEPSPQRNIGGFPVRLPSLDIHTIGAGGGSIARIDPGGALTVGPESAGADPGPACYGRGGEMPTVTDANLLAGRISADAVFPGLGRLDTDAARKACEREGVTADGIIAVVNANMERAIRTMTIERGHDPREMALVAFGGAGPLHACDLATALGMKAVIVPPRAGVLSAVGLLCSPRRRDLVRSWMGGADLTGLEQTVNSLAEEARSLLVRGESGEDVEIQTRTSFDCRYQGQSHELTVPSVDEFHDAHLRRNGYARHDSPIEVVAMRATVSLPPFVEYSGLPAADRSGVVAGPDVISEEDTTIWVPDGWKATVASDGSWLIRPTS